jgi:acyl-CoA reductase-like NAD-dependent aldehyde dehydrogenase
VRWASVLVDLAAVAAAGCGGGGAKPLSKAELIERGDAICAKYRKQNEALNKDAPARNPTDPQATDEQVKAAAPVLEKLADHLRSARGELAELEPPADIASDWQNTLDDLDQLASKLDRAAAAARKVDRQQVVNEYGEILRLNRRVSSFEKDYGFKVCGSSA